MSIFAKKNKKWWNEVTPIHAQSKFYNLQSFKKGKCTLGVIEREELGDVKGKDLLHLMCHFGLDTLSWAREGANVTGVDFSESATSLATKISKQTHLPATFICSDVFELDKVIDKQFDIIYASYGVLCWVPDIKKFANIIKKYLKPDGVFYMVELHPFTSILSYDFKISYQYFQKGPVMDDSFGTYVDWDADIHSPTYLWSHTFSDIINAFSYSGLRIHFIHEFPYTMYDQFPGLMKVNRKGQYVLKNKDIEIPLLFSIMAGKQ